MGEWLNNLIFTMPSCPKAHDEYIMVLNEMSLHDSFLMKRELGVIIWFVRDLMSKWNHHNEESLGKFEELNFLDVLKHAASILPTIQDFVSCPSLFIESRTCQ